MNDQELRERGMCGEVVGNGTHQMLVMAVEINRLQAIVDKLPKTADGVPVVPGMVVYRGFGAVTLRDGTPVEPAEETVCGICVSNDRRRREKNNGVWTFECPADTVPFGKIYSTLKAAREEALTP